MLRERKKIKEGMKEGEKMEGNFKAKKENERCI